jgi:cobyrinic acid a,c-diamide synthase
LEALEEAGAELIRLSPLADEDIPDVDGFYIGGGFPEVYAAQLSSNHSFRLRCAQRIAEGIPVWAECGGMMYLARSLRHQGQDYPLVGALPVDVELTSRPQGHGYVEARVDQPNGFLSESATIRGHEFHYSHLTKNDLPTVLSLERGVGVGQGRDGIRVHNVIATYTHLHALATREWAPAFVRNMQGTL